MLHPATSVQSHHIAPIIYTHDNKRRTIHISPVAKFDWLDKINEHIQD
jgi:hypothetical protein